MSLLLYMNSLPVDVAWIPTNNAAMRSLLLNKNLLLCVGGVSELRGEIFRPSQCFACSIVPLLKEYLPNESQKHNPKESSHPLDVYQ